jgi:DNA polymerase
MNADPRAIESLLAFWAAAGVDGAMAETAVDRLRTPTPAQRAPAAPRPVVSHDPGAETASPAGLATAAAARDVADGAADLAALARAIAGFEGCGLSAAGARRSVFSRGPADAPAMVIGEAPGADEDAQGEPFVGRAGKLLDRMLAAAGLEGRVFITNTVFWRPPGNRTPTADEQLACRPFLERAIALVRPKLLLLAGGAAAQAMLGRSDGILSIRGRWFEWRSQDGDLEIPALPTLHPSFLLRQPGAKPKAWEDLLTFTERLDRPERPS